ncbi:unnamed protein product [Symbiodinium pilosum]|uniref:Uncharacterized protein n=1 Tax=Symbiodinium pilosum TaxID=2952 RepID=A0A812IXG5_SYMPI|nr:unnamed protein product [Symbiodinium pilosum]
MEKFDFGRFTLCSFFVPDIWKDLEEKNKEAELAVDAANAAASEAYREDQKKAAAAAARKGGGENELADLD